MSTPEPRKMRNGMWQVPSLFGYPTREKAVEIIEQMVEHPEWVAMGRPYSYWLERWEAHVIEANARDKREARREARRAARR